MLRDLKLKTLTGNLKLNALGMDSFGYGNLSLIDRDSGLVVARPAGKPSESLSMEDMLVFDLMGNLVEGSGRGTDDLPVHLELYRNFADLDAIAATRSTYATAFAQAGRDIPFYGALHADFFGSDIPCVRRLEEDEFGENYASSIAGTIIEELNSFNPEIMPAVLVRSHGAYVFGLDADDVINKAAALEETAHLAFLTELLNPEAEQPSFNMMEQRFYSRHNSSHPEETDKDF